MKILILAALAAAAPALAQETPMTTPAPAEQATPADPSMQTPPAPDGTMAMTPADSPMGGYGPTTTNTGPAPAGATIRYQQAMTPDQAYPAPAPMAKYPVCKKGQYDNCIERNSRK